jgi:hypothetical protein
MSKNYPKMSKCCQKLLKNCQKVFKKYQKNCKICQKKCQKVVKKFKKVVKSCQKVVKKITGRRRSGRRRWAVAAATGVVTLYVCRSMTGSLDLLVSNSEARPKGIEGRETKEG